MTDPRRIRTQAETHHPEVRGPAPVRNQVRSVMVRIDTVPGGKLRISAPGARGWARTVQTRDELVRAVGEAFTEAQLASYASFRGEAYDLDALSEIDDTDPLTASAPHVQAVRRSGRSDVHSPLDWVPLEDGSMRSPRGRVFGANTEAVKRVKAKRAKLDYG